MQTHEFIITYTKEAENDLNELLSDKSKKSARKAVRRALNKMKQDLRHPSLNTHKYNEIQGPNAEEVFESYAQNNTPGAYRIFWFYGPRKKEITIVAITPHP
jgi:hypothetical protein